MQLNKFEVGVLVSYAFAYPTVIKGTLTSYDEVVDTCNVEVRSKGTELILFDVPEEFTGRSGPRGFTVSLRVYYPEEDSVAKYPYRDFVTYTREFSVDIGTKNAYEPKSNLYPTEVRYHIILDGAEYLAVLMYNKGEEGRSIGDTTESAIRHAYSLMNWLIFNRDGEIITDDELYKQLAWIAEVAHLRRHIWTPTKLNSLSKQYSELATLAKKAEAILIAEKIALNIIMAVRGKILQSWTAEKLSKFADIAGVTITSSEMIIKYLKNIKFADNFLKAVKKSGGNVEGTLAWLSIISLQEAADNLKRINKLLTDVNIQPVIGLEALKFIGALKLHKTMRESGRRFLFARYADEWRAVKEGIMEIIPLSTAPEVYEKLKSLLGLKDAISYFSYIVDEYGYFELCERILKEEAIKFRDAFISELNNTVLIKLTEAPEQHKLHLHVYDAEGRHIGPNMDTGLVEVEVPGAYYFDLGRMVLIILPSDVSVAKIEVDSRFAEEELESYSLSVSLFREGREVKKEIVEESIKKGESISYELKISDGELKIKPVEAAPHLILLIALPVAAAIIIVLLLVDLRRKRAIRSPVSPQ